jgi:PAS domain S-box-containing protein
VKKTPNTKGKLPGKARPAADFKIEAQALLAAIITSSHDAIASKTLEGIITTWNAGAERMFGYTAEEMIGQSILRLIPPEMHDEETRILERIKAGQRIEHYETVRLTKEGQSLPVSLTISPIRDTRGRIVGASKIARDISEQKHLSELQERMAAIVESSDDAIISKDLNGIIRSWNPGAERIFGYTEEEIVGQHISTIAAPDRLDEIPSILERISRGERVDHYETKRKTKDGKILTVSLTVSPIRDAAGNVIGASKVARDVTEQVRQDHALREANAALSRANADLQQFADSASHDLQEPLRMVAAYSDLLQKRFGGQLGPTGEDYIRHTVQGAMQMEALLRDLRTYTQVSMHEHEPREDVDADKVLGKALANLEMTIKESGATIGRTALPSIRMHEFQLQQLFQNLIRNAIRYRGIELPRINIAATRRDKEWLISVRDNGIGIAPEFQEQVFGIFKRLNKRANYPGTGMGLAICQRIIERTGGRIWVESQLGRGSTFFFTVPASAP